ncbi:MAG: SEL1-like repeat protein [Alphaproteobacteria bacterium]
MARAKTWSVKGIDHDTRALAREAAARGEQPIGAWIDRAIRARTGLPPESETSPDTQDALPGIDETAATATEPAAQDRAIVSASTGRGGAWYAVGGVLVVALIGGGVWIMDRTGRDQPTPVAATTKQAPPPETAATSTDQGSMARLIAKAKRNNPAAQYDLGLIYARGETATRDDSQAAKWFESAAKQGLPAAQFNLGVFYEQGRGVARDLSLAFFWYQSAAEQGHAEARHNLGTMLAEGKGAQQNYEKAAYWFNKAAEAGITESSLRLGMLYERGLGRPRDVNMALDFYRRAAAKGNTEAKERITALAPTATATATGAAATGAESEIDLEGIAELQRLLRQLELSPGTADGVLGRKTVAAIRMYQEFAGLPVNGKPTRSLLADLRQVVGAMGGKSGAVKPGR